MNGLSFDIVLIFIPGLVCAKLYFTLTSFRRPGYAEMAGYSLVLGFLTYLVWTVVTKSIIAFYIVPLLFVPCLESPSAITRLVDPNISLRQPDIAGALILAGSVALTLSYLKQKRALFKLDASLQASQRYSTDSVFVEFNKLAQNQYVRVWRKAGIAYEGMVHLFYEHPDMYEVVLTNVELVDLREDGQLSNKSTVITLMLMQCPTLSTTFKLNRTKTMMCF